MKKEKKTKSCSYLRELGSIILIIFLALLIRTFLFEPFFIPSSSMNSTLLEGDYIISTKYNYGYSKYSLPFHLSLFNGRILASQPKRGDIIIFRPPHNMSVRYIKRLIGLPGDRIQIKLGQVFINNKPVERRYNKKYIDNSGKSFSQYFETLPNGVTYNTKFISDKENFFNKLENTHVFEVPEGHYFFLGDNRDQSLDSRLDLGFVPFENFIAKARFIFFSDSIILFSNDVSLYDFAQHFWNWIKSIRIGRMFQSL